MRKPSVAGRVPTVTDCVLWRGWCPGSQVNLGSVALAVTFVQKPNLTT